MLTPRDRPTLRRKHQRPRLSHRGIGRRQQVAGADCARSRRLQCDDAVLRQDAGRSGAAPEQLADPQSPTDSASGIVPGMLVRAAAALLLTLTLTVRSATAQAPAATAVLPPAVQPAADAPRVRLVATGGTISNRIGGRLTAEELITLMPNVGRYARPEFEQFANVASSQLTLEQWLGLARRINQLYKEDSGITGVVVTSGTDTLEELAYFLDLTVRSDKPVVVVGSMRNPSTLGYEGAANLLEGFRVAAEPAAKGRGVMVVLNDEINAALEVTKTDALRLHTFQSRAYGILGVVDSDRVVFYRRDERRHTQNSEFDITLVNDLPRVDVIVTYQGASGDLI